MDAGRAFNTGRILVYLTEQVSRGDLITIDPSGIKVSLDAPIPGTQNAYPGSIIGLNSEDGRVKLEIDVGEVVRVVLPADSEILPHLRLGSNVWISLEPGAVSVLAEHAGEQP